MRRNRQPPTGDCGVPRANSGGGLVLTPILANLGRLICPQGTMTDFSTNTSLSSLTNARSFRATVVDKLIKPLESGQATAAVVAVHLSGKTNLAIGQTKA